MSKMPTIYALRRHPELAALYALELYAELATRALQTSGTPMAPDAPYWTEDFDDHQIVAGDIVELLHVLTLEIDKYRDCVRER